MGNGTRSGSTLNFQITGNYAMGPTDYLRWQRAFAKASELLYNATEGQLRFGNIFVTDDNLGVNNAEYILDPSVLGRALATFGRFGDVGQAVQLPAYAQRQVLSIVHELGHHLWALDEEYARAIGAAIDETASLPAGHDNKVIPLESADLGIPDADFAGADALLNFGAGVETREIQSKVGAQITVTHAFSQNPQDDTNARVTIQWVSGVECTGDTATGACIMEFSRSNAGELEDDGSWTPAAQPVTEFCTAANHDPDGDTGQHERYAASCWETILADADFGDLSAAAPGAGDAAETTAPAGYSPPQWIVLEPNPRFALVLDRSGSMNHNGGARLAGAKIGASYWIENAAIESDRLTVVWYNTALDVPLALTDVSSLTETQVQDLLDDIDAQSATGGTGIRDALLTALGQLLSPGDAAAVQAALLLTDGAHNFPPFSSMLEAVPSYQDANTNVYTLGIGQGDEMDLAGLQSLADETGGQALTAGDGFDVAAIQNAMIEINQVIRGGLVTTEGEILPDTKSGDDNPLDDLNLQPPWPPEKRPTLRELLDKLGLKSWQALLAEPKIARGRVLAFPIEVEDEAESVTFTLSFEPEHRLWMYLLDPDGDPVDAGAPEIVAWRAGGPPYEIAKVARPKPGRWIVLALRPRSGMTTRAKAIAGIQHRELSVYARAARTTSACGDAVRIQAGARYLERLTGLRVHALLRGPGGTRHRIELQDPEALGDYEAVAALPPGMYRGVVELRSPGSTPVANYRHALLHASDPSNPKEAGDPIVKQPPWLRHVPISFFLGRLPDPKPAREEQAAIADARRREPRFPIASVDPERFRRGE